MSILNADFEILHKLLTIKYGFQTTCCREIQAACAYDITQLSVERKKQLYETPLTIDQGEPNRGPKPNRGPRDL